MLDFKDIRSYDRRKKLRRQRRKLLLLLCCSLLLLAAGFIYYQSERAALLSFQEKLLAGKSAEFAGLSGKNLLFFGSEKRELLFLAGLLSGKQDPVVRLREGSVLDRERILKTVFDRGDYRVFRGYLDCLDFESDYLELNRLLRALIDYDAGQARKRFDRLRAGGIYLPYHSMIADRLKELDSGRVPMVFDAGNRVLGYLDTETGTLSDRVPGFAFPEVLRAAVSGGWRRIFLTLDLAAQESVDKLFRQKNYRGSFLLADLSGGALRVAYSRSAAGGNAAFSELYEPASIMKCLTLLAYAKHKRRELFPLQCDGLIAAEGRIFYDWLKHGRVGNSEQAMAQSCNVAFARMAEDIGLERLLAVLGDFRFNAPAARNRFFSFEWGKADSGAGSPFDLYDLGVGLERVRITAWHSLWLATRFALSGRDATPYLVEAEYNPLQIGYYLHRSEDGSDASGYDFASLKRAMLAVTESDSGTLRKISLGGVRFGAKTGTGGKKDPDYDAVIIGFFPYDAPRYSFALFLRDAGRADRKAAPFLKELLDAWNSKR